MRKIRVMPDVGKKCRNRNWRYESQNVMRGICEMLAPGVSLISRAAWSKSTNLITFLSFVPRRCRYVRRSHAKLSLAGSRVWRIPRRRAA
ncbi:hypothetical protein KCP74_06185 [Salmonella enterica subsp. enterica]|nr:hypothetical protein KCP74_06185 [Salmonella enterica subsp. enterica]